MKFWPTVGALVIASATRATAQPAPEPLPILQAPVPNATDVSGAPIPGAESGRLDIVDTGDSSGRVIARGLLFFPKAAFIAVTAPVEGAMWAEGRYHISHRYYELLYNADRTMGLIPAAMWETGYGLTIGARFFDLNTFGGDEALNLVATGGFNDRVSLLASIDTGNRLGPVRLEVLGNFDIRGQEPFYGIGNSGNFIENPGPDPNVNAFIDPTPIKAYFRYQEERAQLAGYLSILPWLSFEARGSIVGMSYEPSNHDNSVQEVYNPMSLVGFQNNELTNHLYGEGTLIVDTRRRISNWEPSTQYGAGTLALMYAGYVDRLDDGQNFWHYGVELQHFFHLGFGPRVLVARLHGEGVTGAIDDVPMTELPMLGGAAFLRGFPYARFRDRIAGVGSLQYMWRLSLYSAAFIFTDVGRVYRDWGDVKWDDMQVGFGAGLELHTDHTFLIDFLVASSNQGNIFANIEFSPILNKRPTWR